MRETIVAVTGSRKDLYLVQQNELNLPYTLKATVYNGQQELWYLHLKLFKIDRLILSQIENCKSLIQLYNILKSLGVLHG